MWMWRERGEGGKGGGGSAIGPVEQRLMSIGNKVTLRRGGKEEPLKKCESFCKDKVKREV